MHAWYRRLLATFMALIIVALLGAMAEAQQLQKSGKYAGKLGYRGAGQSYELEKGHVFWVGVFQRGILQ